MVEWFLCLKKTCLVLLLAIISRMFQLILVKLLFFCVFIIIRQEVPLRVFTAELICMQRWACELA